MRLIDPAPRQRDDGGTDWCMPGCPCVCYSRNAGGKIVASCTFCESRPGWVDDEIYCSDPDCKT